MVNLASGHFPRHLLSNLHQQVALLRAPLIFSPNLVRQLDDFILHIT